MCKSNEGRLLPIEIVGKTEGWAEIAQLQDHRQPGSYPEAGSGAAADFYLLEVASSLTFLLGAMYD